MNSLYCKEIKAKNNWKKLRLRLWVLFSIAKREGVFPEKEPISYAEFEAQLDNSNRDKWYESGQYTISPLTIKYQIWDSLKAALYLASMFTFVFETAFELFEPQLGFMFYFEICVDLI